MADLSILDRTVAAIKKAVTGLPKQELAELAKAEEAGKTRKTVLALLGDDKVNIEVLVDGLFDEAGKRYDTGSIMEGIDPTVADKIVKNGHGKLV